MAPIGIGLSVPSAIHIDAPIVPSSFDTVSILPDASSVPLFYYLIDDHFFFTIS